MQEYGFLLACILPYKDRIVDEKPYSRIFYAVQAYNEEIFQGIPGSTKVLSTTYFKEYLKEYFYI